MEEVMNTGAAVSEETVTATAQTAEAEGDSRAAGGYHIRCGKTGRQRG